MGDGIRWVGESCMGRWESVLNSGKGVVEVRCRGVEEQLGRNVH